MDTGLEPNEDEDSAFVLPAIDDCDKNGSSVDGILNGSTDKDWYKYTGTDGSCVVDPTRDVTTVGPIRICKFFACLDGTPSFDCPSGTTQETSPTGRPGCCSNQGFTVNMNCGAAGLGNDSADVYMRIDTSKQDACLKYTLKYHF
jgi:hypothetical protein